MKRVAKWFGIGVASLLALIVFAGSGFYARGRMVAGAELEQAGTPIAAVPLDDAALLERGEHFVRHIAQCTGCHAPDLAGADFIDDGAFGFIPAPNLTAGQGGTGASYDDAKLERAIRHGIAADGRPMFMMPSHMYQHMADEDLAAVIAWVRTRPAVDRAFAQRKLGPVSGVLTGLGLVKSAPDMIDHEAVGGAAPPAGPTAQYGEYLVNMASCRDCHGMNLDGVHETPGPPAAPSLVAGAATWTAEQFLHSIREGKRPDGSEIDPTHMPWPGYAGMTDAELQAIHSYLKTRA